MMRQTKKWVGMTVAAALLASPFAGIHANSAQAASPASTETIASSPKSSVAESNTSKTQHLIVVYKNQQGKQSVLNTGKLDHQFKSVLAVEVTTSSQGLKKLEQNPNVSYIAKNVTLKTLSIADKNQPIRVLDSNTTPSQNPTATEQPQWDVQEVHAPTAWNEGVTGAGVKVAVIDTGIGPHTDLKVAGGASFVDYTNSYNDDNGHGTNVAGIIAAQRNNQGIEGVAPDVSLYSLKVMDQDGQGDLESLLSAIDWSISHHMDIINMSLGTPETAPIFKTFVDKAYKAGILVVAAAGNDGKASGAGDTMDYPAKYDSVIGVTAVDKNLARASFSSTGPTAEIAAPGVDVKSTFLNNGFEAESGTSQAAPHVTGLLALLKQANPTYSNVQLRSLLDTFYTTDIGTKGRDPFYGYGFGNYVPQATVTAEEETQANAAVSKAESQKTATNLTAAQNLVNFLPDNDSQKAALQARLDTVKTLVTLLTNAQNKVTIAQKSLKSADLAAAQQAVSQLPDGTDKTALQQTLTNVQAAITKNAQTKVAIAKKTMKKSDWEAANYAVTQLPDGTDKTALQQALNTLELSIIKNAQTKMSHAEKVKTGTNWYAAQTAINQIIQAKDQVALEKRLAHLESELTKTAQTKVASAENHRTKQNVDAALNAVGQLKSGSTKTSLMKRLQEVEAKQVYTAKADVRNAQHYRTKRSLYIAQNAINNLQNTSTKRSLQITLKKL